MMILYEDEDIIVCVKPAGVPAQSDRTGDYDMVSRLMNHIAEAEKGKRERGIPYLAVVHRLDRPVGGVMVYAKKKEAAAALTRQIQKHQMTKRYYCVLTECHPDLLPESEMSDTWHELSGYLMVDKRTNLSKLVESDGDQVQKAELKYRMLEAEEDLTLAEVELLTGRHHQIRLQMTSLSSGIWGDTKYNRNFIGKKGWYDLALFSHELSFRHPRTGKQLKFEVTPEGEPFQKFQCLRLR